MTLFARRSVRLSLFVVCLVALQVCFAARVIDAEHELLDDTERLLCPFPNDEDGAALELCRQCSASAAPEAASAGKSSLAECCATVAVQEVCQTTMSLRSSDDDDYDENSRRRSQSSGISSSKFFLGKKGMFQSAKRPRNTFLGKRESINEALKNAHGRGGMAGQRRDISEKRPSRNKFLGKRSDGSSKSGPGDNTYALNLLNSK